MLILIDYKEVVILPNAIGKATFIVASVVLKTIASLPLYNVIRKVQKSHLARKLALASY